jgi:polyhydroxybutyrate depolymerase
MGIFRSTSPLTAATAAVAVAAGLVVAACGAPAGPTTATSGSTPATTATSVTTVTSVAPATVTDPPGTAAPQPGAAAYGPGRHQVTLTVDGTPRTATLVVPADATRPAPLVFAFHGHGGNGNAFDKKMDIEGLWPDAIVVYPDGLVGHKGITDPEGVKPGWQTAAGEDGDRDLHFYDALFADVTARTAVDPDRIFLMGHSNGSAFTSFLLNARGDKIAATANMSAQPGAYLATDPVRSMFMMMGEKDPIVPYENQKKSIPLAERKLQVDPAKTTVDGYLRIEQGADHHELATYVHPAGHEVPDAVPPLVVAFFQRHTLAGG